MGFSRRDFLKAGTAALTTWIVPGALLTATRSRADGFEPALVVVFLRGGADFLNLVVPQDDPDYYGNRPDIAVPAGSALDLDGFFGFHPSLAPLLPLYETGRLAVVHACGSPDPTRSHFDAQDFMEFAAPGDKTVRNGWLSRYLAATGISEPWAAISLNQRPARALVGPTPGLAFPALADFKFVGSFATQRRQALAAIYSRIGGPLTGTSADTEEAFSVLSQVPVPTSSAYPSSQLGQTLKDLAALLKARVGVRVATVDMGGWDTHQDEVNALPAKAADLSASLSVFASDLGSDLDRTLVLVMTEFGRRVQQNGGRGTDHGHGGGMFAIGAGVAGGQVLLRNGSWPGLATRSLFDGIDLAVTTDFRDVFAEALQRHMGLANLTSIFPGYSPSPARFPGILA